ncbi:MAG: Ig-like domain-containing protein [Pseudonocardiaceae bacterium]
MAASLLVGGVANSAPPGSTEVATEAVAPTITTTTLAANPAASARPGTPITLTATITPTTAVGAVQFRDGTAPLGDPVPVINGTATATPTLSAGSHSLTAMFIPGSTALSPSATQSPLTFMVVGAADTNTMLTTTPAADAAEGDLVTLNAVVVPADAVGTVQFRDGAANLGDPRPVNNGLATGSTSRLGVGSHALNAVFIPANAGAFNPSMSSVSSVVVTGSRSGSAALVTLDSQDSGLSLDIGTSILDGRSPYDGRQGTLDGQQSVLDERRTLMDGRVAVLDRRGLLSVTLGLG